MKEIKYITKEQAQKYLRNGKAPVWLNEDAMRDLRTAVELQYEKVVLIGKLYHITYGFKIGEHECVRLNPDRGFVPMGYIRLSKIMTGE